MDRDEIENRLTKLTPRHATAFAVRAAAMVLPVFALRPKGEGPFLYWNQDDRTKLLSKRKLPRKKNSRPSTN